MCRQNYNQYYNYASRAPPGALRDGARPMRGSAPLHDRQYTYMIYMVKIMILIARPEPPLPVYGRPGETWAAVLRRLPSLPPRVSAAATPSAAAAATAGLARPGWVGAARGHCPSRYPSFFGTNPSRCPSRCPSRYSSLGARAGAVVWPFHCGRFKTSRNRALSLVVETALFH